MIKRMNRVLGVTLAATAVAAIGTSAPSSAQLADCGDDGQPNDGWCIDSDLDADDGDAGGVSVHTVAWDPDHDGYGKVVRAIFHAEGEKIFIEDSHDNDGREAIARVWIGGSGPAVFYGEDDGKILHDESYADGQSVRIQVCTSDSPNAICTDSTQLTGTT